MNATLTQSRLHEVMHYDPATGEFRRRVRLSNRDDFHRPVGHVDRDGYLVTNIDGRRYKLHRLAWLYMTGAWPVELIDHIDQCRSNNRWTNLRQADRVLNQHNRSRPSPQNRSTGLLGATKIRGRYSRAIIRVSGERLYLGAFDTPEQAHEAYMAAKKLVIEKGASAKAEILATISRCRPRGGS